MAYRANSRASLHPTDTHQLPGAEECLGKELLDCCRLRELPQILFTMLGLKASSNEQFLLAHLSRRPWYFGPFPLCLLTGLAQTQSKTSELCWWSQTSLNPFFFLPDAAVRICSFSDKAETALGRIKNFFKLLGADLSEKNHEKQWHHSERT